MTDNLDVIMNRIAARTSAAIDDAAAMGVRHGRMQGFMLGCLVGGVVSMLMIAFLSPGCAK